MEFVFAQRRKRRGTNESGIRAIVRNHGPQSHGARGVQLFGTRYGQYGSAGTIWNDGTKRKMAEAAAGGRDSIVLLNDRAGRSLLGRHQYWCDDPARRRRICDSWTEVVVLGSGRSSVQDRDFYGQDRSFSPSAQTAVADPRATRSSRRQDRAPANCIRLRPNAAGPFRNSL